MVQSSYLLFALFLIIALSVLFGSHYLVYYSVISFFRLTSYHSKFVLAAILSALTLNFFLASYLAHWKENLFIRFYYLGASIWLGILAGLVFFLALGWLIVGIIKITGFSADTRLLGSVIIIFTLFYSAYGVWNAFHPKVKEISVKINNLPDSWKRKKAIQISDVHIGHIIRGNFLSQVIETVNAQNPDIIFITGDLFDGMDGDLRSIASPLEKLHAPDGIYYVTGNHETYLGVKNAMDAIKNTAIKTLDDQMIKIDGMQIIGLSYPERGFGKNNSEVIKNIPGFDSVSPSILLYHSPTQIDEMKKEGISLQLSGHTHKGQFLPIGLITKLMYKGHDYGLYQDGNFSLYTSSGIGVWGPTMRTNATPEIVVIRFE